MSKSQSIILFALCVSSLFAQGILFYLVRKMRKLYDEKLQKVQDWAFKEIHEINPGILEPDSVIEKKEKSIPATVYNPNTDPMGEFKGVRDDWHGADN